MCAVSTPPDLCLLLCTLFQRICVGYVSGMSSTEPLPRKQRVN